jgi:hypothetical protein
MMDIDEELETLYRVARAQEAPERDDREAVRAAVASALAATTVVVSTHAAAGTLAAGLQGAKVTSFGQLIAWLCVGAALGGMASSAAWVAVSSPQASPGVSATSATAPSFASGGRGAEPRTLPATAAAPLAAAPGPAARPPVSTRGTARSPVGVAQAARREAARSTASASHAAAATTRREMAAREPKPGPATPSLTAESEGLLAIQRALGDGDAPRALKLVGEQDAHFRAGVLAEERAVVRVLALCAAGRRDQARLARDRFLLAYPRSPHAKRVLGSCASDDGSAASGHGE